MFVTCSFNPDGSGRAYTYACNIADPLEPGANVVVKGPQGDEKIVTILDVDVPEPPFQCKPILRVHVPDGEPETAGPDAGDGHEGDGGY